MIEGKVSFKPVLIKIEKDNGFEYVLKFLMGHDGNDDYVITDTIRVEGNVVFPKEVTGLRNVNAITLISLEESKHE